VRQLKQGQNDYRYRPRPCQRDKQAKENWPEQVLLKNTIVNNEYLSWQRYAGNTERWPHDEPRRGTAHDPPR
jgi:hypothetical protein